MMPRDAWMSAIMCEPKPFNNFLVFEWGLWQGQARCFADVPKRSVCERPKGQRALVSWALFVVARRKRRILHSPASDPMTGATVARRANTCALSLMPCRQRPQPKSKPNEWQAPTISPPPGQSLNGSFFRC
jgi:hypothetical protein